MSSSPSSPGVSTRPVRDGLLAALEERPEGVTIDELAELFEFYGVTVTIRQPLEEVRA